MLSNDVPEYRVHSQPSRIERWRHIVEIVAFVGAAVWALYVFVYQERIKPASEAPNLQISRAVSHEPLLGNKELVTVTMTLKNIGTTDVSLAGVIVNAYGVRYSERDNTGMKPKEFLSGLTTINRGLAQARSTLLYSFASLYRPLGSTRNYVIRPGVAENIVIPFVIRHGIYDTLRLRTVRCDQRADNNLSTPYTLKRSSDGAFDLLDFVEQRHSHPGIECTAALLTGGEYAL